MDTVEHAIKRTKPLLLTKPIEIKYTIADEIPHVMGDPIRISEVLENLLTNAIKYTDQGRINITVSTSPVLKFQNRIPVIVSIEDTGWGIPQDKLQDIFEPFTRLHELNPDKRASGTGLGLHIVKSIIELMDGEISVTSTVGKGSTFTFTIHLETVNP
jgi:signal transduction histidine kinase